MKDTSQSSKEKQSVVKPEKPEEIQQTELDNVSVPAFNPQVLPKMAQRGAGNLRRAAVLQMQRRQGNSFVQRFMAKRTSEDVQRIPEVRSQDEEQSAPSTAIGDGSASVKAQGGTVKASASMVELNSPMVKTDGVLQADTIIANSVVAASYTPGAGNIW